VVTVCTVPPGLTGIHSTLCPQNVFVCVWISEQTAIVFLHSINWLVFITKTDCVYCAVRTGSLCVNGPLVTACTTRISSHTFYVLSTECVLCGSDNKQRLIPYTASTDWFCSRGGGAKKRNCNILIFKGLTARRLYKSFGVKGLKYKLKLRNVFRIFFWLRLHYLC
jgi:hypothetical protein